ncbi:MAG: sigma-70 family RNA polymerase sigma factor [Anaerolineae bacterium]|jgi:RNA polymerase sigma-70 factor (ECF subfamily)|nr:sigma-70 family RNA polymerase sigma factor [Anaerolineae bacterium]
MNDFDDVLASESDDTLAAKARSGDRAAFELLCTRYLPVVYHRLRMKLPLGVVEDVAQEVFLAATRSIRHFRGDASYSTWILRIAQHKIADYYRGDGRAPEPAPLDLVLEHPEDASADWRESIAVQAALEQLPEHYQIMLLLRFAEGLPFNAIAQRLGISLDAAKSRYRRAVAAIAEALQVE